MKNLLFIVLAIAAIVQANPVQPQQYEHSGLYFGCGAGFTHASISHLDILSDTERYNGIGPYADLRLGWTLSRKTSIHGTLSASTMTISYFHTNDGLFGDNSSYSSTAPYYRLFVGGGATFYPVKNPNAKMSGLHIGVSLGYLTYNAENSGSYAGFKLNGKGLGTILEFGKTWKIGEHWGIGIGETNTIGLFGKETSYSPGHSSDGGFLGLMSFGIQAKITRR